MKKLELNSNLQLTKNKMQTFYALGMGLLHFLLSLGIISFSLWLCLALWVQMPLGKIITIGLIGIWIIFALSILGLYFTQFFSRKFDILIFLFGIIFSLTWYFNIQPQQNRLWDPEGARLVSSIKNGNLVTVNNVRNFKWYTNGHYDEHWENRQYNLNDLSGVNIITSYWMGPQIAHTLVSFDFKNQRPLVFSIEIRKEKNEKFSAIGGFFRQFELSLIAADEKDILYTRSNIRHEKVYFFPINLPKNQIRTLFLEYLETAKELQQKPRWYNTLTSNCTTIVFDMVQTINQEQLPKDYRIFLSGYIPNYLYDRHVLSHNWTITEWYQRAYINSRTQNFQPNQSSTLFSNLVRQEPP